MALDGSRSLALILHPAPAVLAPTRLTVKGFAVMDVIMFKNIGMLSKLGIDLACKGKSEYEYLE